MERGEGSSRRDNFLIAMYEQMWDNVDRHILVIWQSVVALLGAFAALAVIEKNMQLLDLGCGLLALVCAWVGAHIVDANYWFRRNLLILTNIERQFLAPDDAREIHFYFKRPHKRANLDHLTIQACLAGGVYLLVIGWHFCTRVVPGFTASWSNLEVSRALPYIVSLVAIFLLPLLSKKQSKDYERLRQASPGRDLG